MWIEELKNGKFKYVERYTDYLTGRSKKVSVTLDKNTAQNRKLAQKVLDEKINKALNSSYDTKKELTLKELVEKYRNYQLGKIKQSTYRRNYHACNALLRILGEDTLVNKLNKLYVEDCFDASGDSEGTLSDRLTRFKALIRWGYKSEFVNDISFLDKIKRYESIPTEKEEDKFLESDELKRLLEGMEIEKWRMVTEYMALSGQRIGEVIALDNCRVDIENSNIHVKYTYDSNNLVLETPKNGSERHTYMQPELKELCKKIKKEMLIQKLKYGYDLKGYFFCSEDGSRMKYYSYNTYLKENSLRILGREITTHVLRHTHGSLLLEQGVPIDVISRRLGHKDINVTKRIYLHVTEKLKQKDNELIHQIKIG